MLGSATGSRTIIVLAGDFSGGLTRGGPGLGVIGARQNYGNFTPLTKLIFIGLMGGARAEVNLGSVLIRRLHLIGSTLRARGPEEKAGIVARFRARFGEDLENGVIRPIVDRVLPLERAQEAHDVVERSEHFGKVVLRVG